jgi:hypothetical protein
MKHPTSPKPPSKTTRKAPRGGRPKVADPKAKLTPIRWSSVQYEAASTAADAAGLTFAAYVRAKALGDAGPRARRRPPVEKRELARVLGLLGNLTSNVNQIAKAYNTGQGRPAAGELTAIRRAVEDMRDALMGALGREA